MAGNADLPIDLYELASTIYRAAKREAWGKDAETRFPVPALENYRHNPVADFDLALASAKAVLASYKLDPITSATTL